MNKEKNIQKLTVVGGAGHIGLPLSVVFARAGIDVICYDLDSKAISSARKGKMPFMEIDGDKELQLAIKSKKIQFTSKLEHRMKDSDFIVTIGTPVDEYMNPVKNVMMECIDQILPYVSDDKVIILRSTIFPGTTEWLQKYIKSKNSKAKIVFCLERVVQGNTIHEIKDLPQVIASSSKKSAKKAGRLFKLVTKKVIYCKPKEAEFAKLFSNAFRYIQFAIANQFYMLAKDDGQDFNKIHEVMVEGYPRAGSLPSPGFAAGPCLFKDTMQLVAFAQNNFGLGFHAMLVNEGIVLHIVNQLKNEFDLEKMKVGLLGMAFKANIDDTRSSLSYKIKNALLQNCKEILTTDPYVRTDSELLPLNKVIKDSDILILCVPHDKYKLIKIKNKKIIDIWNYLHKENV